MNNEILSMSEILIEEAKKLLSLVEEGNRVFLEDADDDEFWEKFIVEVYEPSNTITKTVIQMRMAKLREIREKKEKIEQKDQDLEADTPKAVVLPLIDKNMSIEQLDDISGNISQRLGIKLGDVRDFSDIVPVVKD